MRRLAAQCYAPDLPPAAKGHAMARNRRLILLPHGSREIAALLAASTVRVFGGALPPTIPSADFCAAVRAPCDNLSHIAATQRRPPEVRPTAFAARPSDLPPRSLMTMDFATACSLVRSGRPRYPLLVHRAAALLHAFFRPSLATMPLRFANPSPPSGWVEDFHLQAVVHTRHTNKTGGACAARVCYAGGGNSRSTCASHGDAQHVIIHLSMIFSENRSPLFGIML
jgi:hypothetical protein